MTAVVVMLSTCQGPIIPARTFSLISNPTYAWGQGDTPNGVPGQKIKHVQ